MGSRRGKQLNYRIGFIARSSKSTAERFQVNTERYIGDLVEDRDVILVDNMIHSGNTLFSAVRKLKKDGCGSIYCFVYHNLMAQETEKRIDQSNIVKEFVTLNTVHNKTTSSKVVTLSVSKILSKYIKELAEQLSKDSERDSRRDGGYMV